MTRAVLRYVAHTIRHADEGGWIFELFCKAPQCGAESGAQDNQDTAQDWALGHTGRTGHDLFERRASDHARVTRED